LIISKRIICVGLFSVMLSACLSSPHTTTYPARFSTEARVQLKQKIQQQAPEFAIVESGNFLITGNLSQAKLQHWRARIQRTQQAIRQQFFDKAPQQPIAVWLFDSAESYSHYNRHLWSVVPSTLYGYYLPDKHRMVMNIASGGGTLTHELVHPYIEVRFAHSPLWFKEGFASLFEQSRYVGGRIEGLVNWRLRVLQQAIKDQTRPSLEVMMAGSHTDFYGEKQGVYYAQARYLMYYLQSKGLLGDYYDQYRANFNSDPHGIRTLLKLLNYRSLKEFEPVWLSFIGRLQY